MRRSVERARRAAADKRNQRARELLLAHLTEEQAHTYVDDGYFVVELPAFARSNGSIFGYAEPRRYCLHRGRDSVIFQLGRDGRHTRQMCTHTHDYYSGNRQRWPVDDAVLAHKLMLEHDPNLLNNAAWCTCYPDGHQDPHLRGPYFLPEWGQQALPGGPPAYYRVDPQMDRYIADYRYPGADFVEERRRAREQRYEMRMPVWGGKIEHIGGAEPNYLVIDEVQPWQPRRDVEGLAAFWREQGGRYEPIPLRADPIKLKPSQFDVQAMQKAFEGLRDAAIDAQAIRHIDLAVAKLEVDVTLLEVKLLDILNRLRELPGEALLLQLRQPPAPVRDGRDLWDRELRALRIQQPDVAQQEGLERLLRRVRPRVAHRA